MIRKQLFLFLCILVPVIFTQAYAQTNPAAVSLPFSLNSHNSSAFPAGVAVHRFSSIPTTRTLSPANGGDLPNQGTSPTYNAGGWYHLGNNGIGLLASGTNPAGAIVVAINTTGLSNINVSWNCKTIYNQASRDNSIALQYRVGTSGNFINVGTTSTYSSTGNTNGHTSPVFSETLPAGANNQAVVQVRWIYWESNSTSGSRDKISVDDISITGTGGSGCGVPSGLSSSGVTDTSATVSWSAVSGATGYEYTVNASSTPPVSGTMTTNTSTAVQGLSAAITYYLHVRTHCSSGLSGWNTYTFTTLPSYTGNDSTFRVMTYNLLNYPGSTGTSREPSFRTVINATDPDILVIQELSQVSGAVTFLNNVMNYSANQYSLGAVINGTDTDNAIYYKSSRFQFISNVPVATQLRDINEFKLLHLVSGDTLILYSVHLKAGNTTTDAARRADEVDSLRKITNGLHGGSYFLVCGDFNIYGASESAYSKLIQPGSQASGKFNDLLNMSGTWNNGVYAIHHTQSPRTTSFGGGATGGLDDRFDMILFSNNIVQPGGFDIVNSTYKAYGNDGQHFNQALNTPPYAMYSSVIASALHDASDHLPVIVDMIHHTLPALVEENHGHTGNDYLSDTETEDEKEHITVSPNPTGDEVVIRIPSALTGNMYTLTDMSGKVLATGTLAQPAQIISMGHLPAGVYFLRVNDQTVKVVRK